VSFESESDYHAVDYRTKQLIVLATDLLLEAAAFEQPRAAARLVDGRVLPARYRDRYDARFVHEFASVVNLTRNLLVSDNPFLPDTLSELAAHAIFAHARLVVGTRGEGVQQSAAAIDPSLPARLEADHERLTVELDLLYDEVFEDLDVLALFDLPDGADPPAELRLRPGERDLLRFENWRRPFGRVPRPHITDDARAWRVAM